MGIFSFGPSPEPKGHHESDQNEKKRFRSVPFNTEQKQTNPDRAFLVFKALLGGPGTRRYSKNVALSFKIAGPTF